MQRFLTICLMAVGLSFILLPEHSNAQCLQTGLNCTAADLSTHEIIIIGFGADNTCANTTGDTIDLILQSRMQPQASTRYDVASIITLDGEPIEGNDNCLAEILTPIDNNNLDTAGGDGPFRNSEGPPGQDDTDACGDIETGDGVTMLNLNDGNPITLPCTDALTTGFMDLSTCWAWANSKGQITCNVAADIVAGTSAKCFCGNTDLLNNAGQPAIPIPGNLPVELVSFEVLLVESNKAVLSWVTQSESVNAGFHIEHAGPYADSFVDIGFVDGAGTTSEAQQYQFSVADLQPGRNLFRLKQVDFDGTTTYSDAIEAQVEVPGSYYLSEVYPNPFNPQATFQVAVSTEQPVLLALYNAKGQMIKHLFQGTYPAGQTQNLRIDGSNLPSGVYFLRLTGQNFSETRQVVLNK